MSSHCDTIYCDISPPLHPPSLSSSCRWEGGKGVLGTECSRPRGVLLLLPLRFSKAGCLCVRVGCRLKPRRGSPEVKGVGDWDEPLSFFFFGFLPLSVHSVEPSAETYLVRSLGSDVTLESTVLQLSYVPVPRQNAQCKHPALARSTLAR